ncbi:GAF domain-containing protein [Pseudonocardia sp.]|jgi:GAF domain-containing protein|uniref:GAF domain-containing protein n=1 Tax=Pseudonocardia sp. TaxID=60912 RepID=UPI0031FD0BEC
MHVDSSLMSLALHVGRMTAADLDLPAVLQQLCSALPISAGGAAAVIMLAEPPDVAPTLVVATDAQARWIGEAQRRAGSGPLPGVIRSGRALLTPDLTRIGPPELAAAAAQSGLTSSLVVPLAAADERFGGLQLLGNARRPVEAAQADVVRPLLDVLVARLVDVRALRGFTVTPIPVRAVRVDPGDVATTAIPALPRPRRPQERPARHRR